MLSRIIKGVNFITWLSAILAGLMIVALILVNSYAVVSRYLLNQPIDWILDVSEMMMLGSVFLGTAYIFRQGGHVSVDIVIEFLPEKARHNLSIITTFFVFLFCLVLSWKSWELFLANLYIKTSSVVQLPWFPAYFIMLYGSFMLLLQSMIKLFGIIKES